MVRFTTKKIESMTLGERMKKIRDERRLTLVEISRNTNVQVKYLECLESGSYAKLPAEVYVKGFLRNYANFMGVSPEPLIKQYEKERKIEKNIKKETDDNKEIAPVKFSSFIITPKVLIVFLGIMFIISGFAYLYKQVDNFVSTPRLVVMKPLDGENINGRSVTVSGVAEKDARVTINGQHILVNEKGEFSEEIGLGGGLNMITVVAKNKFDKETIQSISVNAEYENFIDPNSSSGQNGESGTFENETFFLELKIVSKPAQISVESDGNLMYNGVLGIDTVQKFEAKEKISITSSAGENTIIKMNGKEEEKLSEESGAVRDIVFTPNGREQQEDK